MTTQEKTKPDPRLLYNQGVSLLQSGRRDEALGRFVLTIAHQPDLAEAWWQAALIFLDVDNFTEALRHAGQAVQLRPEEPTVWATWADAVALSGDAQAEKTFLAELRKSKLAPAFRLRLQDRFGAQRKQSKGSPGRAPLQQLNQLVALMHSKEFARAEQAAARLSQQFPDSAAAANIHGVALSALGRSNEAMKRYDAAIRIDPFFADPFFNKARELVQRDALKEALVMARAAIARAPDFAEPLMLCADILVKEYRSLHAVKYAERAVAQGHRVQECLTILGRALSDSRDYERARDAFARACAMGGDQIPDTLTLLGTVYMKAGDPEKALELLDKAIAIDPDHSSAIGRKASTLGSIGRFEEARPLFVRAMELDPTNGDLFRGYMTGTKAKPGDPVVERMLTLIEQPGLSPRSEAGFGFAIAKGLEDQKEYTRAFPYLKRANDLMSRVAPYDHKARQEEIARFKEVYTGANWSRKVEGALDKAPIFITGMPRSGTTLIEQIVSSHSRVTGGDEMEFLPVPAIAALLGGGKPLRHVDVLSDADFNTLARTYISEVEKRFPAADIVSDKSINSYMYLGLTKLALPNARFIVVRRDPRDNLLSIYRNRFPEGAHLYAYDLRALAEHYATFVEMVEFWRSETPDWFTEVQYETLVANPEEESRRLIAACGLDWEDGCLDFHRNERQVRTLSVYQVRQPISGGSVKAWQRYEKELAPMFEVLAERGLLPD